MTVDSEVVNKKLVKNDLPVFITLTTINSKSLAALILNIILY